MAQAYSDDSRKKLLEAHDTGKATLAELAERFGVSRGWAWKISSVRAPTGATARPPYRPGRKARVDRQVIERLLEAQPELLLRELGAKFTDRTGVSVSLPHVWRLVRSMGSRLKKCRSTPLSATPRPTGSGAKRMSKGSGRLARAVDCRLSFEIAKRTIHHIPQIVCVARKEQYQPRNQLAVPGVSK